MPIDIKHIQAQSEKAKKGEKPKEKSFDFLKKEIQFGKTKFKDARKERFYNQLSVLLDSGVDLGSAIQLVIDDERSVKQKQIFETIFNDVISGNAFSDALRNTKQFSEYEYYSIKVGEESGRLQEVLTELNSYYELRVQQKRQLSGSLSYPIVVLVVAFGAVIFMLNVVVPMFSGVFQRFGGELPPITRTVLALSNWFSNNILLLALFILSFTLILIYLRRFTWYKKYSSLFLLRLPLIGKLMKLLLHARFCHSVALLSQAQVPLLDTLEMVRKMIVFYPMREAIENTKKHIEKGGYMYEGMQAQKIFDRQLIALTKVGEEVNQVGVLYAKLYKQYTVELKHLTSVMGNLLEPILIVFVGALVMLILIAMYLPLFQLSTTVF